MSNGTGRAAPQPEADRESTWPTLREDVVEPKSSPVGSRPEAPAITFSSAPAPSSAASAVAEDKAEVPAVDELASVAPAVSDPEPAESPRDDVSVPPVDIDAAGFFDAPMPVHDVSVELDGRDPRATLKRSPAAAKRRAELTKYVTATMGVALALCVAALVKSAVAGNEPARPAHAANVANVASGATIAAAGVNMGTTTESAPSPLVAANSAPADTNAPAEKAAEPAVAAAQPTLEEHTPTAAAAAAASAPVPAADPAPAKVEPPSGQAVAEPPAAPAQPPAPVAPPPQPVVVAAPAPPPAPAPVAAAPAAPSPAQGAAVVGGDAKSEKEKARGALERGRLGEAIVSGERSVALDPSDAEGWLILGAAYLQRGDAKNSSRAFKSCIDRSSHGPKGECAAMLH